MQDRGAKCILALHHPLLLPAAGKVLPNTGQPAPGQLITTAAGQQCLPLNMIRKLDGQLEFVGVTLGQVQCVLSVIRACLGARPSKLVLTASATPHLRGHVHMDRVQPPMICD